MIPVVWSDEAVAHLAQIHSFISSDSQKYADKFIVKLMEAVEKLSSFPELGRRMPDVPDPAVREFIVAPYRIVYQVGKERLWIAAVVHSSRDLGSLEEKPRELL